MSAKMRRMRWAFLPALALATLFLYRTFFYSTDLLPYSSGSARSQNGQKADGSSVFPARHPITTLIEKAEEVFRGMESKETHDLKSTAQAYREARGRHPPPGFDAWFEVAKAHNVMIVEEFWDQIYHDLRPFWALPANQIRADARASGMVVNIKGGQAEANTGWNWHVIWAQMIGTISQYLPDMVVPCNELDESRLLVPWENIKTFVDRESESRNMIPIDKVTEAFHNWNKEEQDESVTATDVQWMDGASITLVRQACDPESLLRTADEISGDSPNVAAHMVDGFVANYTLSTDICHQPDLGIYHGAINQPLTSRFTQHLVPLFGGSKFARNNEILLPPPIPWTDDERFSLGDTDSDWNSKANQAIWRGTATGGRHHPTNWHQFHRHRFLYLSNGTKLQGYEPINPNDKVLTPAFLQASTSILSPDARVHLSTNLRATNDFAFTDLFCDAPSSNGGCWYLDPHYSVALGMQMSHQFNYKYLPDIDGNSFSGRYRAFLLSQSLPIKATIYREWHDSRLVAWKHFVPMDNRFTDYYGILEYFRGFEATGGGKAIKGHDDRAKKIATDGRDWANKVLRKEDMQIYVFRLLLEYARICDDNREKLGYVADLK